MSAMHYTYRSGRCRTCRTVFQWPEHGRHTVRVSEAKCPRCRRPLERTATALIKHIPIVKVPNDEVRP